MYVLLFFFQILFGVFLWFEWNKLPSNAYSFGMYDIPEGDALFFTTPEGHSIVIDGGIDDTIMTKIQKNVSIFNNTIDAVFVTHPDDDHINGIYALAQQYSFKHLFLTGTETNNETYKKLITLAEKKGIPIHFITTPQQIHIGNLQFHVLYPHSNLLGQYISNANNTSIVMRAVLLEKKIFLSGDIEEEVENELLQSEFAMKSDILKVAHHGSKSSSTPTFLLSIHPTLALISAEKDNRFGHPHDIVLTRMKESGITIRITAYEGDIIYTF